MFRRLTLPIPKGSQQLLLPTRSFSPAAMLRGPLLNTIKNDHRELESYYPHIADNKNSDERIRYRNLFVWELARQLVAKDLIVYPAMEEHLRDGRDVARKSRDQHQAIKEQLYRLQNLKAEDPDFESTFHSLSSDLQQYAKEAEERELPELENKLDDDSVVQLCRSFERTKELVPTRSHPLSPKSPPFETAAALLTAPIDKVADIFRKFPKQDGPML